MEIADIPLIGGHPALDFLNALEERATPAEVNYLPGYEAQAENDSRDDLLVGAGSKAETEPLA